MIWETMSVNGTAALYFLPVGVTMNDSRYVNLLREKLQLHMAVHHCSVFMRDCASCQRSKVVQSFLDQQRVNMLEWPRNSSDLNPIENLRSTMKSCRTTTFQSLRATTCHEKSLGEEFGCGILQKANFEHA